MLRFTGGRLTSLLAATALVTGACRNHRQPTLYQVAPVERRNLFVAASGQGTIQPIDSVNIRSRTAGEVVAVGVAVGDRVRRQQMLVQIDPRIPRDDVQTTQAELIAARAGLTTAEAQLVQARELYQTQAITQQEFDSVSLVREAQKASVVRAQTAVENARIALSNATIEAPGDGIVLAVRVNDGMVIPSTTFSADSTALLTIGDIDSVEVVALVSEIQIAQLQVGMDALISVDAFPDSTFRGQVTRIEPQSVVQNQETDFPVHVLLPNPAHTLKPGMNAEIVIETSERDSVLAVPYAALRTAGDVGSAAKLLGVSVPTTGDRRSRGTDDSTRQRPARDTSRVASVNSQRRRARVGGQYFVFIRQNNDIRVTSVRTGVTDLVWAEVRDGLSATDTVLVLPSQSLVQSLQDMQQRTQRFAGLPGMGGGAGGGGGGRR